MELIKPKKMTKEHRRLWKFSEMTQESLGLKDRRFDMDTYAKNVSKEHPCGTVGCKLGMVGIAFPRADLTYSHRGPNNEAQGLYVKDRKCEIFFGLDPYELLYLFYPTYYNNKGNFNPTETDVNNKIKEFLIDLYK